MAADGLRRARLAGRETCVELGLLAGQTFLDTDRAALAGTTVAIATSSQMAAGLALIEWDGRAARMLVCPPDLTREHLNAAMAETGAAVLVTDWDAAELVDVPARVVRVLAQPRAIERSEPTATRTEWVLFTSGTSGRPKMVGHTLAGLAGAITPTAANVAPPVWSTFYDIRRYGGLQIFLRAVLGGGTLVIADTHEALPEFLGRVVQAGVTHMSGTPSHWRRVLMGQPVSGFGPRNIRLSGEIADQGILDALRGAFPHSSIVHAFASTEAGVGFEVSDGKAGFPESFITGEQGGRGVWMKVEGGTLHLRSDRTAQGYTDGAPLLDGAGYVDTGDMVELREGRYYFNGRRGGIINVGGLKVNPEEMEAVINRHPAVRMALVKARKNPVTGAIVVAEIVLTGDGGASGESRARVEAELRALCRASLAAHKVPALMKFVPSLTVTAGGKLARA